MPAGVPALAVTRWTLPGRAIASITDRNVDCADSALSAKPGGSSAIVVIASPLTAHHRVEIDSCRRRLCGLAVTFGHHGRTQRRDHLHLDLAGQLRRLHHGVAQRD